VEDLLLSAIEYIGASEGMQTGMHTEIPFVPKNSASETEVSIGKLKR
jgi:hypothetical protein